MKGEVLDDSEIAENASETLLEELEAIDEFDELELALPQGIEQSEEPKAQEQPKKPDFTNTTMDKHS